MEEKKEHKLKFRKEERLRLKNLVDPLFREGAGFYDFPLRAVWRLLDKATLDKTFRNGVPVDISTMQMMVTVPKKKRRHAVDRVKIRRRIREAYRLNRLPLKKLMTDYGNGGTLSLGFIYISQENEDYLLIERKMRRLLQKVENAVRQQLDIEEISLPDIDCFR